MTFKIGYFYNKQLNLYGDTGNIEIISSRASRRGYDVEVIEIDINTKLTSNMMKEMNFVFMGGGPDSGQKDVYKDLINNKGAYLKEYIENGGYGLYICGAYQLLGHYYKSADNSILEGLGIFDLYTQHFGNHKPRCVGNMYCKLNESILKSSIFEKFKDLNGMLIGFENHGGRTYLGKTATPMAIVSKGFGNNGDDATEGVSYKNSFGSYLHGPIFSKNPHFVDFIIYKSLGLDSLPELDDNLVKLAHLNALKLLD